jgi:hypothetical protein
MSFAEQNSKLEIRMEAAFRRSRAGMEAGCNGSVSFAGQNSKLEIRMDADFARRAAARMPL